MINTTEQLVVKLVEEILANNPTVEFKDELLKVLDRGYLEEMYDVDGLITDKYNEGVEVGYEQGKEYMLEQIEDRYIKRR